MKVYLTCVLLLSASISRACGGSWDYDAYHFYNLFHQTSISDSNYYAFLKDEWSPFYEDASQPPDNAANLALWQEILSKWSILDLSQALYGTDGGFEKTWAGRRTKKELRAKSYMQYARKCSKAFEYRHRSTWEYSEIIREIPIDVSALLNEGSSLLADEKNEQLRLRYAYQIIRVFHYSKRYQDAINFFEEQVESKFKKSEIYYYAMDQVAGCYYSMQDYDRAAYLFLQVFSHSIDKKRTAFRSYNWCTHRGATGEAFCTTASEKADMITMESIRSFSDELRGVEALLEFAPTDTRIELLFMRGLNGIEREIWPTHAGYSPQVLASKQPQTLVRIKEHLLVADKLYASKEIENKDFWLLCSSYLSFLSNDFKQAREKINLVENKQLDEQKKMLGYAYEVFSWHKISGKDEMFLAPMFRDLKERPGYHYDSILMSWKKLIMERIGHLYFKNKDLAKAYLIHNHLYDMVGISSLELIDDLTAFAEKKKKNEFEKLLVLRLGSTGDFGATGYLNYVKGLYYLREADPKTAYTFLRKSSPNQGRRSEGQVSARIFSNNTIECFNCPETLVMVDSVFLAEPFSFIKSQFDIIDLSVNLIKLDSMSRSGAQWKRKLAAYLLGNYYFNISNTGYFRGTLSERCNCCSYGWNAGGLNAHQIIKKEGAYNLYSITNYKKVHFEFSSKAYIYYEKVISNSDDQELNARCLYMMAKAELNMSYNGTEPIGPYGIADARYKTSFKSLKEDYNDTEFYKSIIKQCGFFRYYCSL